MLYRCPLGYGDVYSIKIQNHWQGSISADWENPLNWSCCTIPDLNTSVLITTGTIVINNNTVIKSLSMSTGVNLTVAAGKTLTILK